MAEKTAITHITTTSESPIIISDICFFFQEGTNEIKGSHWLFSGDIPKRETEPVVFAESAVTVGSSVTFYVPQVFPSFDIHKTEYYIDPCIQGPIGMIYNGHGPSSTLVKKEHCIFVDGFFMSPKHWNLVDDEFIETGLYNTPRLRKKLVDCLVNEVNDVDLRMCTDIVNYMLPDASVNRTNLVECLLLETSDIASEICVDIVDYMQPREQEPIGRAAVRELGHGLKTNWWHSWKEMNLQPLLREINISSNGQVDLHNGMFCDVSCETPVINISEFGTLRFTSSRVENILIRVKDNGQAFIYDLTIINARIECEGNALVVFEGYFGHNHIGKTEVVAKGDATVVLNVNMRRQVNIKRSEMARVIWR